MRPCPQDNQQFQRACPNTDRRRCCAGFRPLQNSRDLCPLGAWLSLFLHHYHHGSVLVAILLLRWCVCLAPYSMSVLFWYFPLISTVTSPEGCGFSGPQGPMEEDRCDLEDKGHVPRACFKKAEK